MTGKSFFSVKKTNLLISVLPLAVPWAAQAASRPWWRLAAGNGWRRLEPDLVEREFNCFDSFTLTYLAFCKTLQNAFAANCHLPLVASVARCSQSVDRRRTVHVFRGLESFLGVNCWATTRPMGLLVATDGLGYCSAWMTQLRVEMVSPTPFLGKNWKKRGKMVQFFVQYKKFSKYK